MRARLQEFAPPGRLADLEILAAEWTRARRRHPRTVVLQAESGIGKTRLVQEFYRALAATSDPDGYWPQALPDVHKAMTIIPTVRDRPAAETPPLPWLWLALRCSNPGDRNHDARADTAFDVVPRQLQTHLAGLYRAQLVRSQNVALAKSMLSVVASFAVPGGGPVLEAITRTIKATDTAVDVWNAFDAVSDRARLSVGPPENEGIATRIALAERISLADSAVRALSAICARRPKTLPAIPIALIVDDAHWADPVTVDVLDRILAGAWRDGWPLLTVICAWEHPIGDTHAGHGGIGRLLAPPGADTLVGTRRPAVRVHRLAALDPARMRDLVRSRVPGLPREAAELLALRCSGDLDLLFDFLDEVCQAPGWLDSDGTLAVDSAQLQQLPSQASAMARRRLRTIGLQVAEALALASAQGPEFHVPLIEEVATAIDLRPPDLGERLAVADAGHGITQLRDHALLRQTGEFRRHVYWEICAEALTRSAPRRLRVLNALAAALRDLVHSSTWQRLPRHERARLGMRLLDIVDELQLDCAAWQIPRTKLELDLAAMRLDMGDGVRTIQLASEVLDRVGIGEADRSHARRLLVEGACTLGDVEQERSFLEQWRRADPKDPHLLLRRAAFLLRQSAPAEAVEASRRACAFAPPGTALRVAALTGLAHALWSAGEPGPALRTVTCCEREERMQLEQDAEARVAVDHTFSLILHDLELNVRVIERAQRCVDAYRATGRLEAELISRVNLGDALWGAGRLAHAISLLEDAWAHAQAAGLPHAEDIAAICLANALATAGQHGRALELYDRGIELGLRIGHDWDEMYGRAHRALCAAEHGDAADPEGLLQLAERARQSHYHYLAALASAHAPLALYLGGDSGRARDVLAVVTKRRVALAVPGPAAQLAIVHVLVSVRPSRSLAESVVAALDRCEGLKGRLHLAETALDLIRERDLLSPTDARLAQTWRSRFIGRSSDVWPEEPGPP